MTNIVQSIGMWRTFFSEVPVLGQYRRERSPFSRAARRAALWAGLLFLGLFYGLALALTMPIGIVPIGISVLLLGLLVIWILPSTEVDIYPKWIVALFFSFMAALSLWPDYISLSLPGLPWISLRRLTSVILTLALFIAVSQRAVLKHTIANAFRAPKFVGIALIVFFISETLSLVNSGFVAAMGRYINSIFTWWAVLFAAIIVFSYQKNQLSWARFFAICTVALCVLNMVEVHLHRIVWAPLLYHLPSYISVEPDLIEDLLRQSPYLKYRSKGIFTTSLSFAEYMALGSPFLMYYLARAKNVFFLMLMLAVNLLVVVAIYTNGSRLGLVGLVVAALTFTYLYVIILRERFPRNVLIAALFWGLPAAAATGAIVIKSFGRLNAIFFGTGAQIYSTQARWDQLAMLPQALIRRPLFGHGLGNGGGAVGYYDPNGRLTIDSYFITAFADFGLVGGAAYFAFLLGGIVVATRLVLRRDCQDRELLVAVVASLMAYLTIRLVLSQDSNQAILFMLVGFVLAAGARYRGLGGGGAKEAAPAAQKQYRTTGQ